LTGEASGAWIDAGVVYRDSLVVYVIAMESITQGQLVGEVIEFAKRHYRQKALYISYLGQVEIS
jgi:hypothetical protein